MDQVPTGLDTLTYALPGGGREGMCPPDEPLDLYEEGVAGGRPG